jgi:hypothetical protein
MKTDFNVPPMEAASDDELFEGIPIPLTNTPALPAFPVDAFPKAIADMIAETSVATQTDPAMGGTVALAALSACTGGHAKIHVRDGWAEPLNVYGVPVAAPGERKSAVLSAFQRPLFDEEQRLAEASMGERLEAMTQKQVAEQAADKAKQTRPWPTRSAPPR